MNKNEPRKSTQYDAEIGFRIRQIRQDKEISQEDVAASLGISYQQLQKYEAGKNRLSPERLCKIAILIGADVNYLLGLATHNPKNSALLKELGPDIDKNASRLWRHIQNDEYKKAILDLMKVIAQEQSTQPMGSKNRA